MNASFRTLCQCPHAELWDVSLDLSLQMRTEEESTTGGDWTV